MATKPSVKAERVVEHQVAAMVLTDELRKMRTAQRNPALRRGLAAIDRHLQVANANACILWFPTDTHSDVTEFLPPAA